MTKEITAAQQIVKRSQIQMIWNRFRKNKTAVLGLFLLSAIILIALCAPLLVDYKVDALEQNISERLLSPGSGHLLGTDQFGRDLFARIIYGARISLSLGFGAIFISVTIGILLGSVSGYYGGKIDNFIMRIMDVFLAIPHVLMAMIIVAALGAGTQNLLIAMAISSTPQFARIVRSAIITQRDSLYIEACKALGTRDMRIIVKHIIPNALGPIVVQATLNLAKTILNISFLSYLGLGVPSPTPEWGAMLSEAKDLMLYYPYLIMVPGCAIIVSVLSLNLLGDGLRDALDPKLKN